MGVENRDVVVLGEPRRGYWAGRCRALGAIRSMYLVVSQEWTLRRFDDLHPRDWGGTVRPLRESKSIAAAWLFAGLEASWSVGWSGAIVPGVSAVAILGETVVGGWGDVAEGTQSSVLSDSGAAERQPLALGLESRPSCGAGVVELKGWLADAPVGRRWAHRVSIGSG